MKKHIIVGTAGHIDHGKTTLIKTLSGIDTDRLKEEKKRGITIELGFAYLKLPGGDTIGIVDVPGHEKFVRHMVAGAAGIDFVMLIIAADEGIMPQTREHLDICRMLGIQRGLIALTKTDLCDQEWIGMVTEEIRDFTIGSFLENSPIIPVSSTTGEGTQTILTALGEQLKLCEGRPPWGIFRLPVDRVFTIKGFGTVTTGTTISGTVSVGDLVRIYPRDTEARVRGLQVHNSTVNTAEAGSRTAINLQGTERHTIERGDTIGHPGQLTPSFIMDVRLHLLNSAPKDLSNRTRIRFHLGTAELLGRVHILEGEELSPGSQALAQIRLEKPAVALSRDRFVIRSYSPASTIGGGMIIDPVAQKYTSRKKNVSAIIEKLKSLEMGSPQEAILAALLHRGPSASTSDDLARSLNIDEKAIDEHLGQLCESGAVRRIGNGPQDPYMHARTFDDLIDSISAIIRAYHHNNPLKAGLAREELKTKLPRNLPQKALGTLLDSMVEQSLIIADSKRVRLASFSVMLDEKQQWLHNSIETALKNAGLAVPSPEVLSQQFKVPKTSLSAIIGTMTDEGTLVKIHDDIYIYRDNFQELTERIHQYFSHNQDLTVTDFKNMTGLSRKYSIPLLEYFDRLGVTLRAGDKRVLKKS